MQAPLGASRKKKTTGCSPPRGTRRSAKMRDKRTASGRVYQDCLRIGGKGRGAQHRVRELPGGTWSARSPCQGTRQRWRTTQLHASSTLGSLKLRYWKKGEGRKTEARGR